MKVVHRLCIVIALILVTQSVWAAGKKSSKPFVLVVPFPVKNILPSKQDSVLFEITKQLRKQYGVRVLSGRAVRRAIWGTLGTGLEEGSMAMEAKIAEGRQAYHMLRIKKADDSLAKAKSYLDFCGAEIRDTALLTDLFLFSGLNFLAQGKSKPAASQFRQAVSMNPKLVLSSKMFPPDVVSAFSRAKKGLLSGNPARVKFESRPPGASVTIDGRNVGKTPISGAPVYPGRHFIRLEKEGYAPWTVHLPEDVAPPRIRAEMVRLWAGEPPGDLVQNAIVTDSLSEAAMAELRTLLGFYQADAAVLVDQSREGSDTHLGVRLIVIRPESVSRARLFNLGSIPAKYSRKIRGIVSTFKPLKTVQVAASKPVVVVKPVDDTPNLVTMVPPVTKPVEPPIKPIVPDDPPRRKGRAWYKSWWFWTLTGVVVVGAATGITIWQLQPEESWTLKLLPSN